MIKMQIRPRKKLKIKIRYHVKQKHLFRKETLNQNGTTYFHTKITLSTPMANLAKQEKADERNVFLAYIALAILAICCLLDRKL